jgi:hypothetical protein
MSQLVKCASVRPLSLCAAILMRRRLYLSTFGDIKRRSREYTDTG